jgi:hypothetical protein
MQKIGLSLALAGLLFVPKSPAVSLDDIQFWTGTGTNRAALVVEWSAPESFGYTTVPAPIADQTLVWGYRFNGSATGAQMLNAILAADPRLYVVIDDTYGTYVEGIGYNLDNSGVKGLTDGTTTNVFTRGILIDPAVSVDAAVPLNSGDLYWGGSYGPNWELWTEAGDAGGFLSSPDRGANPYWTPTDPDDYSGFHGQWGYAPTGLDWLALTNGSWLGFSVAAGEYEPSTNAPYNAHKRAPAAPDASLTVTVSPVQIISGHVTNAHWQVQFSARGNWLYTLERTADFKSWTDVSATVPGVTGNFYLQDTNPTASAAFYRVRANRP